MVKTVWTAVSCQILSTAFKQQHWIPPQLGTDITTAAPLNGPYNLRDCDLPAVAANWQPNTGPPEILVSHWSGTLWRHLQ